MSISETSENYDVIILGAGAAGLSAALWCDELGLKTLLLESAAEIGGQLLRVYNAIENHLGGETENGLAMRNKFAEQINKRAFALRLNAEVAAVDLTAKSLKLADGKEVSAKALILATGVSRRQLGIAGENDFAERGMLESGKRDRTQVAGKIVCIIGGGDAAAENALILAEAAAKVYLIHRRKEFRARLEFLDQIKQNPRIEILTETEVTKIIGDSRISAAELQNVNTSVKSQIKVDAVLLRVGVEPNTRLFKSQLKIDAGGYIEVNNLGETNVANVFAIGDVANPLAPTISGAVGTGATAAKVIRAKIMN